MSKGKKLFKKLYKEPMSYGQMQGFLFKLNDDKSYPREKLTKNGHPNGYWGTNLAQFINNRLIYKGDDKLYRLTELGKLNMNKPFADVENLKQSTLTIQIKEKEDLQYYKESYRDQMQDVIDLRNQNWKLITMLYEMRTKIDEVLSSKLGDV